jgi:hypothetical protein
MRINRRSLSRTVALVLVVGAIAAPIASARVISDPPQPASAIPVETIQLSTGGSTGFDWGDAGIGAGAVAVVAIVGLATRLTIARHRQPRAAGAKTTISAT